MTQTAPTLTLTLDDKYIADSGRVYLTGSQALARLPMLIRDLDLARGLNTGGFISGYRGSPLGGLDQTLWKARDFLKSHHIHFQPGINEDLAATAVWGSQQVNLYKGAKYDGVFAMWYGKGPGVDRSMDVLKHASAAGTSKHGGVLCLAGDDHACKSSTFPHQSEQAFIASMIPVFNPSTVQEFLEHGTAAIALSRYAGLWTAMKTLSETVDGSASVLLTPERYTYALPDDFPLPASGLNIRWPDEPAEQEDRLVRHRLPAVLAFARANALNRATVTGPTRRYGIVATGKAYADTLEALESLGISTRMAAAMGISIFTVALVWPLEPESIAAFTDGLDEVLIVEEKRSVIEAQLKEQLFNRAGPRPRIVGKTDETGAPLLRETLELNPVMIARVLVKRLSRFMPVDQFEERLAWLETREALSAVKAEVARRPYYCSGCPHNTSTVLPEGSRGMAGIGCHYMVRWMDRNTTTFTQMGGEGVPFVGQAPFVEDKHVFVNLGDGTYFHSGILAVRQSVAAGINITYKLLYNDAVAMTGGQPVDGTLTVPMAIRQLEAEGVTRIIVVADDRARYEGTALPGFASLRHRDELDAVQKELREVPGVTVLVYDQTCAAEKRRRRKRKLMADPPKRVMINEAVCEGCGDCSKKSNCLSVVPVETEAGRKRQIDQSSCNKDYSCTKGFCPSFVTVHGGKLRPPPKVKDGGPAPVLPEPVVPALDKPYSILVTGVGGTGVVTIGALLGMAAHIEGKGATAMDQTGLAQKGGAVTSHVRLAPETEDIHAPRINYGHADLLLGCDIVVSASGDILARLGPGLTRVVLNTHESITGDFVTNPEWTMPGAALRKRIETAVDGKVFSIDAGTLATALCGDALAVNAFMMGLAWQQGLIPLSEASLLKAIELNGAMVEMNKSAFAWGRRSAVDPQGVARIAGTVAYLPPHRKLSETLDDIIQRRVADLTRYQDAAYAARFKAKVDAVRTAEAAATPGRDALTRAVALNLYKLMAYKDEYEVARLYTDGEFLQQLRDTFSGDYKLQFHLAPPILSKIDPATGEPKKMNFGPWMLTAFRLLAKMKGLRGTKLDIFGRNPERKLERQLIADYETLIAELTARLTPANHAAAVDLAAVPALIRGYGPVKERNLKQAKIREAALLARFRSGEAMAAAAE